MLLSVTGAPADASALQRFQEALDSENQPHPLSLMLGSATLSNRTAAAFDRVLAVRTVARQLKPLARDGWLVLPSIRFEGHAADELDFFLLAPSGQAYALLVQRYEGGRMKASGTEVYGRGYRDSLPQAVQDRSDRVRWLLREEGIAVANLTSVAVLVDAESVRYWGPKSVMVTPNWKLIAALRKRERQLSAAGKWAPVRDERLLSSEFWGEAAGFSQPEHLRNRRLHQLVARRLAWGRISRRAFTTALIALASGLLTWFYLSVLANSQMQIMIMK